MKKLEQFKNRQVVVNIYKDGELINKDGFNFDKIEAFDDYIHFLKEQEKRYTISLKQYPSFQILDDFKNYFSFSNGNNDKIEIYFP